MPIGQLRFNRQEWAGAFGDIGTDFPLIVGMILAAGLDPASVLVMYGLMQVITGLLYQRPMPVQPLKAVAALVITQKIAGPTIYGAGIAIALCMLLLTSTGLLEWIARHVPKSVVRGIQMGLGINLATLALKDYIARDGLTGYLVALFSFVLLLVLLPNKKAPAALVVLGLGLLYACVFNVSLPQITQGVGFSLPAFHVPSFNDIATGFLLLALPQIPLSLGNSILATRQVNEDLFPQRPLTIRKIGVTYSLMNVISPLFSGIPVCHGSGGMVGHYTFGARSGASLLIYGGMYLILGFFFSRSFSTIMHLFPMPVLGAILFIEALALMLLVRDLHDDKEGSWIAFMVALMACALPNGFIIGLIAGILAHRFKIACR